MKRFLCLVVAVCLLMVMAVRGEGPGEKGRFHVWLYWHTNLGSDQNLEKSVKMVERMAKAGYTGIAYLDNQLMRTGQWDAKFDANLAKFREACTKNKMEL